jgi:hypothetical protein
MTGDEPTPLLPEVHEGGQRNSTRARGHRSLQEARGSGALPAVMGAEQNDRSFRSFKTFCFGLRIK